jgi:putative peptide modification system cyclase
VLSDLKSRDTLALMQRKPGTALDRAIASEIALRDGARAVILPTVSEVGGRVRVSAEVIDPHTQTTVYAESADGTGAASTLDSIDTVTAALRGKLGEALQSIEKDSEPLPKVSTGNLDALRAYALGQKAYARGHELEALQFYERATELDPEFALAWIGQVRARFAAMQAPAAVPALRRAKSLRSRLPPREALYLDAWASVFEAPSKALGRWQELASLYPDYWPAQGNTTIWLYNQNRFSEALPYIRRQLVPQNETAPLAYDFLGRVRLGMEQYPQAAWAFDQALAHGYKDSLRRRADVEAAQRKFSTAQIFLNKVGANDRYSHLEKVSIAVDQAKWNKAQESSRSALALVAEESGFDSRLFLMPTALADWLSGDSESAMRRARAAADKALTSLAQAYDADAEDDASLALSAGLFAQRLGDVALAKKVLAALALHAELMTLPNVAEQATLLRAADARLGGQPEKAIELLKPLLTGHERYQTRVELQEACAVAGQVDCALEQAHWLLQHRGLAYMEQGCGQCLQALNVADSNLSLLRKAELLSASGKPFDASRALADFDQLWPPKSLPIYLRTRRAAVLEASSRGGL